MRTTLTVLFLGLVLIAVAANEGCGSDDEGGGGGGGSGGAGGGGGGPSTLTVTISPLGSATATGTAVFEKVAGDQIKLTVTVSNVMPVSAQHGIHIHANGDCGDSSDGDGGTVVGGAAGGHWNPEGHEHGSSVDTNHLGDIGNIMVDANGSGSLTFMTAHWEMGTGAANDILNHALVLHAGTDDGATQPTGNSGGRIGCAVIH
jgi:Cu-Zn family superoxide dismutase